MTAAGADVIGFSERTRMAPQSRVSLFTPRAGVKESNIEMEFKGENVSHCGFRLYRFQIQLFTLALSTSVHRQSLSIT